MDKVNEYITIKGAAKILGVSKITLRNWDKAGKLQAHRHPLNNYRIYKTGDIEKIIEMIETVPHLIKEKKNVIKKLLVQHLEENDQLKWSTKKLENDYECMYIRIKNQNKGRCSSPLLQKIWVSFIIYTLSTFKKHWPETKTLITKTYFK